MDKVIELLINKKWLISTFEIEENAHYNPANYIYNIQIHKSKYILLIDTNIFSFIVNSFKQNTPKDIHREAIALIAFCQFAEINIDVSLPIYEYIRFNKEKQKEAFEKLELFFKIDDSPNNQSLIDYAIGKRNNYTINETKDVSDGTKKMIEWYNKYQNLVQWDSTYLIILKITELNLLENISNIKKFEIFMNWQHSEFRFSMIGSIYSIIMFSSIRTKGMMKYKPTATFEEKRNQIDNMTWDFYFMINYYERLKKKTLEEEILTATDDKVIKFMFKILVDVNNSGKIETLSKYLKKQDFEMIEIYKKFVKNKDGRKFKDGRFQDDYHREKLKKQLETCLL
ncbi:hypothetical protein [Flavobacterium limnophilum]|uniref:hypothetical protein n=1 Tax=Flavobacterium limnophilum TaxID=3003262 RepID=UPI0022AC4DD3|nr:hypothetical protein [Flavobacterium limnophilum]